MEGGLRLSLRHTGSDDRYLRRHATKSRTDRSLQPLRYSYSRGVLSPVPGAHARLAEIPSAVPHIDVRAGRHCAADASRITALAIARWPPALPMSAKYRRTNSPAFFV